MLDFTLTLKIMINILGENVVLRFLIYTVQLMMKMVGDNNDGGGDDDDMKDDDDEIWCLLVPAFRTGDKANVPTYLPHGFPPANTVEHILQIVLNIF